ncbi:DnaJ-like subfamily C GRV2 [Quillaja saponaria]|uniref:DnaJ-like subfamily C GRV2 n=1 Tax=Quillaja saponaria TaxID=32244 RepID=A0AAD7LEC2_QUISA|nr:DnaJ-like subfamily C GRV2 [Quillaja saponaria]
MRTIAEEDAIAAESMRDAAVRDGTLLRHLLHAFFLPASKRREVSQQLVDLWADSYQPALELLSRVLPPDLVAYLHACSDGALLEDTNEEGSLTSRRQRRLLQQRKGRTGRGITSHEQTFPAVNNFDAADPAAQTGPSVNLNEASELNSSIAVNPKPHAVGLLDTGVPAPAQVFVENTPVGSGRLLCNWTEFWRAFGLDHNRADLIWNEQARQELKEALQAEVHKLDVEKERTEDIVPGGATVEMTNGQENVPQISWNYSEFSVHYPSLLKEVCVGQYYLRLLLDSGSGGRA